MQLILMINVDLDQNEKYTYIIFLLSSQNRWKYNFLRLGRWFKGHWIPRGIFSTWFVTINFSCKCTCNQMWKKHESTNEIVGFSGLIVFP